MSRQGEFVQREYYKGTLLESETKDGLSDNLSPPKMNYDQKIICICFNDNEQRKRAIIMKLLLG